MGEDLWQEYRRQNPDGLKVPPADLRARLDPELPRSKLGRPSSPGLIALTWSFSPSSNISKGEEQLLMEAVFR
jgi:hypothetical protein